jgi:metallopeptidase MepB
MAEEKYAKPPQAPPIFTVDPESLITAAKTLKDRKRNLLENIIAEITVEEARFENVLLPIERFNDVSSRLEYIIGFYQHVSMNKSLSDASATAERTMNEGITPSFTDESIYKLIKAASLKGEELHLESQKLQEETRLAYSRLGLDLPAGPKRNRLSEITKAFGTLKRDFRRNMNKENEGIWFTKEQLKGVPADVLEGLEKGSQANQDKLKLSFQSPDLSSALRYTLNPEVRKKVFIAYENSVSHP